MKESTRTWVGYSNDSDGLEAGKAAAEQAMSKGASRPSFVLAFCSGAVDHGRFLEGIRRVLGRTVPVLGGSAIGVVTPDALDYKGSPSAVAVVESEGLSVRWAVEHEFDKDERGAGRRLADELRLGGDDDRALLVFYDSIRVPASPAAPPVLNSSAPLLAGIADVAGSALPVIGAGLLGDYAFGPTQVIAGDGAGSQRVAGLVLSGDIVPYVRVMHGCTPLDGVYRTITKIEGAALYELDGRPVTEVLDELAGPSWRTQRPVDYLTLCVNYGPRFEDLREDQCVNRLITGPLPTGDGIGMFEPDLEEGMDIQLMFRDTEKMLTSVRGNTEDLLARVQADGARPILGLYIDCAGRTAQHLNADEEEAAIVQETLGRYSVPLLGFYSGVEIAPMLGGSRGLDWTGVLLILAGTG